MPATGAFELTLVTTAPTLGLGEPLLSEGHLGVPYWLTPTPYSAASVTAGFFDGAWTAMTSDGDAFSLDLPAGVVKGSVQAIATDEVGNATRQWTHFGPRESYGGGGPKSYSGAMPPITHTYHGGDE